jgi:hypothetical protein
MNVIFLIGLLLATPSLQNNDVFTIPYQSQGNVEIYSQRHYNGLFVDLQPKHQYECFDEMWLLPVKYWGESELYNLGFYFDLDKNISSAQAANDYRILYYHVIPEPQLYLFLPFLILSKRKLR